VRVGGGEDGREGGIGLYGFLSGVVSRDSSKYTEGRKSDAKPTTTAFIERTSAAQQRMKWGANVGARFGGSGETSVKAGTASLYLEREIVQGYERVVFTALYLDGLMDTDNDRFYIRPKELLAEIDSHRERWILRGMETMPHDLTTTQKRAFSIELLDKFVADLNRMHAETKQCVMYIHYTMSPEAACHLEMLEALKALEQQGPDGDERRQELEDIGADVESLLRDSSSSRPSSLNLLPKHKLASWWGFDFLVKAGVSYGAEAQTQVTEYPPRFTPKEALWQTAITAPKGPGGVPA
jgi:hypothetical protein